MDLWILRVDILPSVGEVPYLSHVFFGESKGQVDASLKSHRIDDELLDRAMSNGEVHGTAVRIVVKYDKKAPVARKAG